MKEVFTSQGARDFRQRYEGTFGFYETEETKRKILVQVTKVTEEGMKFQDRGRTEYEALADKGHVFDFIAPVKRMFDHRGKLALIMRRPARQFQRGISGANTVIHFLGSGTGTAPNFTNLKHAFDKHSLGFNATSFKEFDAGERDEVVLSDMLGIAKGKVFLYNLDIGTFDRETKTLKVKSMFRQEVSDCVRDNGIKYAVEVV